MRRVVFSDKPPVSGGSQKKRSPSDLRRDKARAERHRLAVDAEKNTRAQAAVRCERVEADARSDVNPFMAASLDRRQQQLDGDKLRLRGEVREDLGREEADTFANTATRRPVR